MNPQQENLGKGPNTRRVPKPGDVGCFSANELSAVTSGLRGLSTVNSAQYHQPVSFTGSRQIVNGVERLIPADGGLEKEGLVIVVDHFTRNFVLTAPAPGPWCNCGDDGRRLEIFSSTPFAHTIILTSPKRIFGGFSLVTFPEREGAGIILTAARGLWYPSNTTKGVTLE